jgi:two-component system, chemotaxis family, sensor kinase CheA
MWKPGWGPFHLTCSRAIEGMKRPNHEELNQAFQEEAREIFVELEATLLQLNENFDDRELVQRAFRALHTIKGSGSMFGFDEVAAFTHDLENAYDEVREERLKVTPDLIDLTLAGLDQIKVMMDEAAGRAVADPALAEGILVKLRGLTGKSAPGAKEAGPSSHLAPPQAADGLARDWHIRFSPAADFMRCGADPLLLLRELNELGTLKATAELDSIPLLSELDAERCYISWDMVLTTSAASEAIRDVFIFVEDTCELVIEPAPVTVMDRASSRGNALGAVPSEPVKEERANRGRRTDDGIASVRVPSEKLDHFVNLVGELVTVQAQLAEVAAHREDPDLAGVSEEIERLTSALRENSMSIRMLPIRGTFERFRRLVHDLARDLHKEVELIIEGAETELDKTVIDQLNDPLMHLIRNSMDHGIEPRESRIAAGKTPTARVKLSARHSGANVLIVVADDGGGIHAEAVRIRAVEKGLIAVDAQLSESQILALIFTAGFSTAPTVTDVSGRGVGMDVVRQRIEALRGTIAVSSKPGIGTSVTLCLPLTMAIIDGLLVRVEQAYFVLPLANTLECVELTRQDIEKANGKQMAYVRGQIIPYIRLRDHFGIKSRRPEREQIMIAETDEGRCGFVVDEVLGDHQTVIKALGPVYRHVQLISGATILGNGKLALILDPHNIAQDAIQSMQAAGGGRSVPPQYVSGRGGE